MPEDAECDHLVKNATELVAVTYVLMAFRSALITQASLAHWCALQILRKLAQSIQSICTAAVVTTWTVHFGARP